MFMPKLAEEGKFVSCVSSRVDAENSTDEQVVIWLGAFFSFFSGDAVRSIA